MKKILKKKSFLEQFLLSDCSSSDVRLMEVTTVSVVTNS